ncbi:cadherin domain-containing protein, partial [Vacuolonema iberomarrocanum]|uniref:cadherin repeat domain-containing protein n=1 Tax=Vacuolonema iberomarrocanum TaxID=3454632 RepID=UPI0019E121DA|nr:cadherin domain-containing protein [filamentous cyanobacterium LEGE 07170]
MSGIPQGGEISVNSTTTGTQTTNAEVFGVDYTPRAIASDAQGNFVVTWTSAGQDGDRNGVYARLYDSNGNPLVAEFQVNTTTLDNQENAVVAMDEDGDFVIAWQGDGGYGIYAQRFDSAGVAQGGEIQVAGDGFAATEIPSIAIDPDSGEFVVAWVADGFGSIRAQRYDSSGNPVGGEIAVSTAPNVKGKASIAMDQNGNFVVVWESDGQDGSNTGIYGRRFDSSGNPLGAEFLINNTTTGRQQSPSVAMDQDGNFVVAWETENQDGAAFGIYARRYDSSGAALDDEFQVNLSFYPGDRSGISPIQTGNQRNPIVTYEQDGDSFAIAWTDDDSGISETAVKRFNEFGTAQGVDTIANVNTTGNKTAPSIAIDSESDFVAVWTSLNGNATEDIYARRFGRTAADAPTDIDLTSSPDNTIVPNTRIEISEATTAGTVIAIITGTDAETLPANLTFSLVSAADFDASDFAIINGNELQLTATPDADTQAFYRINLRATDEDGGTYDEIFEIFLGDISDEAPTDIELSNDTVDEASPSGTVVATLTAVDPDVSDTDFTFRLVSGPGSTDNGVFSIAPGSNELVLNEVPDFETKQSYDIRIEVEDTSGLTYQEEVTISVNDLEDPTDIELSNDTIAENSTDLTIGTLSATDPTPSDTFTFALVAGDGDDDNADFTIVGNELSINTSPDFETQSSYSIRVRVTDASSLSYEEVFTITVANQEFEIAPSNITLDGDSMEDAIAENQPIGTVIGILAADDPELPPNSTDALTFTLAAGVADNDLFQIGGANGDELQLNFVPDFETQNSYTVEVIATDAGGNESAPQTFTINILDVEFELPPTDITLDNTAIDENDTNPVVGNLSADDPELPGDTITFSLPNGFGNNDDFTIVGTELRFVGTPDFETQNSYSVQILATDAGGNTYSEDFTITVNNLFEVPPDDIILSNDTIAENSTDLTIGTLTATDPEFAEGDDTFTFSLPAGVDDNDLFTIAGDVLSINTSPDFETQASYTLQIQVEDEGGNTFQETFTITVTNEFDIPPSALA